MYSNIFAVIISIIEYVVLALFLYQFAYILIALVKKDRVFRAHAFHKYAFIISAKNEESVIANLIKSIHSQNYPSDYYEIFVVADNCTDNTAQIARDAGAIVYERSDKVLSGKGYALHFLFDAIERDFGFDAFEAFIMFDADNLLDKRYLREINKLFDNGFEIISSFRNSKNYGSNWVSACTGLWFIKEAKLLNRPRFNIGLSCSVPGTGFLVSSDIIKSSGGWNYYLLTEDMEFSIDNITKGRKIAYCDKAVYYDEQPLSFLDSWNQRLNWTKGYYQVLGKYGKSLFKQIFTKHSFTCYDMLIILSPGYIFFVAALLIFIFTGFQTGFMQPAFTATLAKTFMIAIVGSYLLFLILGLVTLMIEWNHIFCNSYRKVLYLFAFPIFIYTYVLILFVGIFVKAKRYKVHHTVSISNEQMQEQDY